MRPRSQERHGHELQRDLNPTKRYLARLRRGGFHVTNMSLVVWTDASLLLHRPTKDMGIGIYWGEGSWASSILSRERPPPGVVTNCHQAEFYALAKAAARGNLIIEVSDDEIEVIEISDDEDEGEDESEEEDGAVPPSGADVEMGEDHEVIVISDSDKGYETCDDENDDGGDDSDDESGDSDDESEEELHNALRSKRRRLA
ncbi:hypothetical protein CcaverHIS002_0703230 [Cutaneotrichosporon cavernicola]|uniref:Uncharacterized protein n=1 Tax=Cutaneotrichosporon cavernicola TaxID=279322 RepID=A0AA48LA71_9TREE|nr:uncharacterized protein CcaverHIS019_0703310 [Cutaneotrichosporon cavernicola]BEI86977.1 hypothetical protein CcaverHIS002_0703230 [Cutaneotrichosporon cavernicola]BEI94750.1 hypothetical protein CcaverHIS019_0703310 [Cutaneotrichosporon cavernicola]